MQWIWQMQLHKVIQPAVYANRQQQQQEQQHKKRNQQVQQRKKKWVSAGNVRQVPKVENAAHAWQRVRMANAGNTEEIEREGEINQTNIQWIYHK